MPQIYTLASPNLHEAAVRKAGAELVGLTGTKEAAQPEVINSRRHKANLLHLGSSEAVSSQESGPEQMALIGGPS